MFATNYINLSTNAFVHPYLAFYDVFISLKTLFLSITSILIYILEVLCIHTGDPNCTHDICIVFLIKNLITYSIFSRPIYFFLLQCTHLFILLLVLYLL